MKPATSSKRRAVLNSSRATLATLGILLLMPLAAQAQGSPFDNGFTALQTLFTGLKAQFSNDKRKFLVREQVEADREVRNRYDEAGFQGGCEVSTLPDPGGRILRKKNVRSGSKLEIWEVGTSI